MPHIRKILSVACIILILLLLRYPQEAFQNAYLGLTLWFERMVPTLFPFMMLSSILLSFCPLNEFLFIFRIPLHVLFPCSDECLYSILVGFFCGFPMGAKTVSELYRQNRLSLTEANYLLSFCNNIGPVYFLGYAYPLLHHIDPHYPLWFCLLTLYGLPLLYGILTVPKHSSPPVSTPPSQKTNSFDIIVTNNLLAISKLAGYMIFFNMLCLVIDLFPITLPIKDCLTGLLEISGGLYRLSQHQKKITPLSATIFFLLIQFGGISCILQTLSFLKDTCLSAAHYIRSKLFLTCCAGILYFIYNIIFFF